MLNFPCHLPYNRLVMKTSIFIEHWLFDGCHNFIRYTYCHDMRWRGQWHCKIYTIVTSLRMKANSDFNIFNLHNDVCSFNQMFLLWNLLDWVTPRNRQLNSTWKFHDETLNWLQIWFFRTIMPEACWVMFVKLATATVFQ